MKYYIVSLIYSSYSDEKITVKARNEKQAILKAMKLLKHKEKYLVKITRVEELNIFECLKENNNDK